MTQPESPHIAELLERVRRRVASAPTPGDVRDLAGQALSAARGSPLTITEIRELADVAISQARQVERLTAQLAALSGPEAAT